MKLVIRSVRQVRGGSVARLGMLALIGAGAVTTLGAGPRGAAAQTVTGTVIHSSTSTPVPGVLVSLLDEGGERVRAVLSDAEGRFRIDVGRFGRYRLRAARIGLEPSTSEPFELYGMDPRAESIYMDDRPVEIVGLVVDSRVAQCRIDPAQAVQIQRWWQEVRTALDVSAVVQQEGLVQFELERFEREWDPDLRRIVAANTHTEMNLAARPFVSAEAGFLAEGGFVQGAVMGQREYYAPDAEVLLSDVFLADHCFAMEEEVRDGRLVGLSFRPTGTRDISDIRGTIWVDSTTAELSNLEFRYEPLDGLPENESGGYVAFEYLPSGAWIVTDWYIRMPKLGLRGAPDDGDIVLLGYTDVGGRVSPVEAVGVDTDRLGAVGSIRGAVFDSIRGRGLPDASVAILGTRYQARTDRDGTFVIPNVPVGLHQVTFFHEDPYLWGLGAPFVTVAVDEGAAARVDMAVPAFRRVALVICTGSGSDAETVLIGHLLDQSETGIGNAQVEIRSYVRDRNGLVLATNTKELRTASDGRFVACDLPSDTPLDVRVRVNNRWVDGFTATLLHHDIAYQRMMVTPDGHD